jgi:drug/metabolite transporter (DMT)-like permease
MPAINHPGGLLTQDQSQLSITRTVIATTVAMIAFAANSILCRLALGPPEIDAVGFTAIRLVSGAVTLLVISLLSGRRRTAANRGDWKSGAALFSYAIMFSFAYISLDVGTGALILFALVQTTMIVWGLVRGERPGLVQWMGLVVALGGLVYLVSPGLSAPSPLGSVMMATAGIAWGVYSLRGRGAKDPIVSTTDNFVRSVPLVLVAVAIFYRRIDFNTDGVVLAVASGTIATGVGYVIWYAALRGLSTTRAASVQLTVPAIAAAGGLALLDETVSLRLVVSAVLILGGVGLTLTARERRSIRQPR